MEKSKKRRMRHRLSLFVVALLSCLLFASCGLAFGGLPSPTSESGTGTVNVYSKNAFETITDSSGRTIYNFGYTNAEESIKLQPGIYQFEVWGASGGAGPGDGNTGGKGGYSIGRLELKTETTVYVYVGGQGQFSSGTSIAGTFNGGGGNTGTSGNAASGGGGTDFRIGGNTYKHRILVAGGGGGACGSTDVGGYGGGTSGANGTVASPSSNRGYGAGATQTAGGVSGVGRTSGSGTSTPGSFGVGGSGRGFAHYGSGGGGGWFGGGGGDDIAGAGGGSGYILTETSAVSGGNIPTDYAHTARTYRLDKFGIGTYGIYEGNKYFLSPTGTNAMGHTGNGYARITSLINPPEQSDVPTFSQARGVAYSALTVDGTTIPELNVTDSNAASTSVNFVSPFAIYTEKNDATKLADEYLTWEGDANSIYDIKALTIFEEKPFYTLVQNNYGVQAWVQFNLTYITY